MSASMKLYTESLLNDMSLSDKVYEIPGPETYDNQSFVIIRRPERVFNVSRDNFLAQRDLRRAGVEARDWWYEKTFENWELGAHDENVYLPSQEQHDRRQLSLQIQ
jgi:hypothetical protein